MTFPLPSNEAVIYAEFVRLLDAREVDSVTEGHSTGLRDSSSWMKVSDRTAHAECIGSADDTSPSVTEPLFPNEEAA